MFKYTIQGIYLFSDTSLCVNNKKNVYGIYIFKKKVEFYSIHIL